MDEREIVAAIRRAGYGVASCRAMPSAGWVEVRLDWHSPKNKWFGVLKRKLARQGITEISHYGGTSQYVEFLAIPYEPKQPADQPPRGEG